MSLVKKQHYVPQFYLRRFAKKGERVHVYDKFRQSAYVSNIEDVASSNYFYDLPKVHQAELEELIHRKGAEASLEQKILDKALEQIRDRQMIEKRLGQLESRFSKKLEEMVDGLEKRRRFKPEYRYEIALMAALQLWRTLEMRESMMELEQLMEAKLMPLVERINDVKGVHTTAKDLGIAFDPQETATRHKMAVFNMNLLERTAQVFMKHIWVLGVNDSKSPLFTSDNPIAIKPHKTDDWYGNTGIASPGIEIVFPLSPKYILIMYDRIYFHMHEYRDGKLSYLKETNVIYYNSLQVTSSHRQLYSLSENFDLVVKMLNDHPELKSIRPRWG